MLLRAILIVLVLLLAAYGAYVIFGHGKVVRVESPTVSVDHDKDKATVTVEKPEVTVEK
jgi:hypothetical protein